MIRNFKSAVCLSAVLSTSVAFTLAQSPEHSLRSDARAASTSTSPVSYVYVASTPQGSTSSEIVGYVAAANGSLTAITGSPFRENVGSMAVNGKYLMAATATGSNVDAFLIESDGALKYSASTEYARYNDGSSVDCGSAGQIFFDHSGASLYIQEFDGSSACANDIYASFSVVKATGALTYLGYANEGAFPGVNSAAYFIGNDTYAYSALNSDCMYYEVYGLKRGSNGDLTNLNGTVETNSPKPPAGVSTFVPDIVVADPTNHLAIAMQPANPPGCAAGPIQIAAYTVNSSGSISTTSTAANMPAAANSSINDMKMAPSGMLLAVGGQQGLEIFHFNGASPATKYTGLLTKDPVQQMFWDNNNHLYAISSSGKLFVYTITPESYVEAPGSPYTVSNPSNIIVQPLPVY